MAYSVPVPFHLTQPFVWLTSDYLLDVSGGSEGVNVSDIWGNSGTLVDQMMRRYEKGLL